jgi:hypothetical protein
MRVPSYPAPAIQSRYNTFGSLVIWLHEAANAKCTIQIDRGDEKSIEEILSGIPADISEDFRSVH